MDLNETHDDELHDDDFNVMETLNEVDDDDDDMEEYRFDRSTKIHRQSLLCAVSICHVSVSHCGVCQPLCYSLSPTSVSHGVAQSLLYFTLASLHDVQYE